MSIIDTAIRALKGLFRNDQSNPVNHKATRPTGCHGTKSAERDTFVKEGMYGPVLCHTYVSKHRRSPFWSRRKGIRLAYHIRNAPPSTRPVRRTAR